MAEGNASSENKENQINNNSVDKDKNSSAYLAYEDFSHVGLGVETYEDGNQHPLELRKILIGDLAKEMSVSFKDKNSNSFKKLVHPNVSGGGGSLDIFDASGHLISIFASNLPKPPKLFKGGNGLASNPFAGGLWDNSLQDEEYNHPSLAVPKVENQLTGLSKDQLTGLVNDQLTGLVNQRKPGRPAAQQGTFDPESGTIRYICRLECGASLASAKGRRKHEKKHCPNVPKEKFAGSYPVFYPGNNMLGGHTLFGDARLPVKKQEYFECRICGKVLKTYEGRRLHEKHQHKPKPDESVGEASTQSASSFEQKDEEEPEAVSDDIEDVEDTEDVGDVEEVDDVEEVEDDDDEDEVTVMDEVMIRKAEMAQQQQEEDDDDDDEIEDDLDDTEEG